MYFNCKLVVYVVVKSFKTTRYLFFIFVFLRKDILKTKFYENQSSRLTATAKKNDKMAALFKREGNKIALTYTSHLCTK